MLIWRPAGESESRWGSSTLQNKGGAACEEEFQARSLHVFSRENPALFVAILKCSFSLSYLFVPNAQFGAADNGFPILSASLFCYGFIFVLFVLFNQYFLENLIDRPS